MGQLYIHHMNGLVTVIMLYVDDLIISGSDVENILKMKDFMALEFKMMNIWRFGRSMRGFLSRSFFRHLVCKTIIPYLLQWMSIKNL